VRANRDATRHRLLFGEQHLAAGIRSVDGAERAGKPKTDDDIEGLVEVGYRAVWRSFSGHSPNSFRLVVYGNRNAAGSTVVTPTACSPAIAMIASSSS